MSMSNRERRVSRRWFRMAAAVVTCAALLIAGGAAFMVLRPASATVEVVSHFPSDGTRKAPPTTKIMSSFSQPLEGAAEQLDIVVTDGTGVSVPGSLRFNGALDTATLQPTDRLKPGAYTVEVKLPDSSGTEKMLDSWRFQVKKPVNLANGNGGSLLLLADPGTRDSYLAEILRAEGLNSFDTVAPELVTADVLDRHSVAIIGAHSGTTELADRLQGWVREGGDVVAMRPRGRLATLAGLKATGQRLTDDYLKVNTSRAPGRGITGETMQFHGTASGYDVSPGTEVVASLFATANSRTELPAVTLRDAADLHGHVAAFSYDLATSVMYSRQGNPKWSGEERDGIPPIRPDDLFRGTDGEADYLDLDKIGIPQADEQMRLLTNIIEQLHQDAVPLPRFWYLPHGANVALLMASDDHATGDGTKSSFEHMLTLDPVDCSVRLWECPRATSWIYPSSPMTDGEAAEFFDDGFDMGAHVTTQCQNWTPASLDVSFARSLAAFREKYPSLPEQVGSRLHCIAWSDWTSQPHVERSWGIRLDMNYYNWPPTWIQDRPGYMTGSALPMRFGSDDGQLINVFQQETHLVNETWNGSTEGIEKLIAAANGTEGYFGVLGTHYDYSDSFDRQLMDAATKHHVPMISARQLLDFTDGRNQSTISGLQAVAGSVNFTVEPDPRVAGMLQTMLPVQSATGTLAALHRGGQDVDFTVRTIKGIDYAFFDADAGAYTAEYH